MAEYKAEANTTKLLIKDAQAHPFGLIEIGEGGGVHFTVIVLDNNGVSWYYWPNSSGVLQYGVTAPDTGSQDSAGASV